MTDRISIPALREQASHPRSRDFHPWREILALVEAVEAAHDPDNHAHDTTGLLGFRETGENCTLCAALARFDFGEEA